MRVTGHKFIYESGEGGGLARCICGTFEESVSSGQVGRQEYRHHLSQKANELQTLRHRLVNR